MTVTHAMGIETGSVLPEIATPYEEFDAGKIVRGIVAEMGDEYGPMDESFHGSTAEQAARMAVHRTLTEVAKPALVKLDRQKLIEQLEILEAAAAGSYVGVLNDGVNRTDRSLGRDVALKATGIFRQEIITLLELHGVIASVQQAPAARWD